MKQQRWATLIELQELPCKGCLYCDHDAAGEYSESYYFCTAGLFLPRKKKTCKKVER